MAEAPELGSFAPDSFGHGGDGALGLHARSGRHRLKTAPKVSEVQSASLGGLKTESTTIPTPPWTPWRPPRALRPTRAMTILHTDQGHLSSDQPVKRSPKAAALSWAQKRCRSWVECLRFWAARQLNRAKPPPKPRARRSMADCLMSNSLNWRRCVSWPAIRLK